MPIRSTASVTKARISTEMAMMAMRPMRLYASQTSYGSADLALETLRMTGYSGQVAPTVQGANLVVYPLGMWSYGLTGGVGQVNMSFLPVDGMASKGVYGEAVLKLSPLTGLASSLPAGYVFMRSDVAAAPDISPAPSEYMLVMNSDMTAIGVVTIEVVRDADARDVAEFVSIGEAEAILGVSMAQLVRMLSDSTVHNAEASVYAVNRNLGSTTRYENYDFTRYLSVSGFNYGVKSDGVYLIGADSDDGQAVRASVDFGKQDFKTSQHKMVSNAYFTLSSSGTLQLRVSDDSGNEYFYGVRESTRHNTVRADLGRGLKANYFELQLYNEGGADFDISDIEFLVAPTSRRI